MAIGTATTVAKWGNSTGLRIPRKVAEQAGLQEGDQVDFQVEAPGVIIVRTLKNRPTLESLVTKINPKNRHSETDWGKPQGHEVLVSRRWTPAAGDFITINFDPQAGHEQAGRRPALVISEAAYNRAAQLVIVCPITNQAKNYP